MSRRRTCRTGKKCYHDADEAKEAITAVRMSVAAGKLTDTGKVPVRSYRCEFCGRFHLTSRDER